MPAKSRKQQKLMCKAAKNKSFAKKKKIPQSTARKYCTKVKK